MSALPTANHADTAAEALYVEYADRIRGFCANRLRDREDAEDATQKTFLNALRALRTGTTPRLESAWLYEIARNVCREQRAAARRPTVDVDALREVLPAAPRDDGDRLEAIRAALGALPDNQRRAM